MAVLESAQDLLAYELKEIHSAERQLSRALPRIMKKVSSDQLRKMLDRRVSDGAVLIEEIDETLAELDTEKARRKNIAAEGLIEDVTQQLEDIGEARLVDPLVLASLQKLEHYCMAAWGTAAALGRLLEQDQVIDSMERALEEGKRFDNELTELAEGQINPAMLEGGGGKQPAPRRTGASSGRSGGRKRKSR